MISLCLVWEWVDVLLLSMVNDYCSFPPSKKSSLYCFFWLKAIAVCSWEGTEFQIMFPEEDVVAIKCPCSNSSEIGCIPFAMIIGTLPILGFGN